MRRTKLHPCCGARVRVRQPVDDSMFAHNTPILSCAYLAPCCAHECRYLHAVPADDAPAAA
eukprot:6196373-Pleurochrysis_carterae.AAC.2